MKSLSWRSYRIQFTGSVSLDRPLQPTQAAYLRRPHFAARRGRQYLHLLYRIDPMFGQILSSQMVNVFCTDSRFWSLQP